MAISTSSSAISSSLVVQSSSSTSSSSINDTENRRKIARVSQSVLASLMTSGNYSVMSLVKSYLGFQMMGRLAQVNQYFHSLEKPLEGKFHEHIRNQLRKDEQHMHNLPFYMRKSPGIALPRLISYLSSLKIWHFPGSPFGYTGGKRRSQLLQDHADIRGDYERLQSFIISESSQVHALLPSDASIHIRLNSKEDSFLESLFASFPTMDPAFLQRIKKVSLNAVPIRDIFYLNLTYCSSLRELSLLPYSEHKNLRDHHLISLAKSCPHLDCLATIEGHLTDAALESFIATRKMREITISPNMGDRAMDLLSENASHLEKLRICSFRYSDKPLSRLLDKCSHLQVLNILIHRLETIPVVATASLPKLEKLDIAFPASHTIASDIPLAIATAAIASRPNLKCLQIHAIRPLAIDHWITKLTRVSPNLETIYLSGRHQLNPDTIETVVTNCLNLKGIRVDCRLLTRPVVERLASNCPNIEVRIGKPIPPEEEEVALRLFDSMSRRMIKPNVYNYERLLEFFLKRQDERTVLKILETVKAQKINILDFEELLKFLVDKGNVKYVEEILEQIESQNIFIPTDLSLRAKLLLVKSKT